jgi:hypothetical protein
MAVTEPIFAKLTLPRQLFFFVRTSHTEFHENLTNSLATYASSETDGRDIHVSHFSLKFVNNA